MEIDPNQKPGTPLLSASNRLLLGAVAAFIILGGLTALVTFSIVRNLVASWEITDLPGVVVRGQQTAGPTQTGGSILSDNPPDQPLLRPTPQPWDGASRVNVLVMGIDYRDWVAGEGAPRTDTMILLSIDPLTKTAGMLSIPRDLWVNIPGFEPNRINTAYRNGEIYQYPGGGPALAMKTVEELLGLKIDYYAQIDFGAFVRFIDEIGGVKIDVPEAITVDLIAGKRDTKKHLKPGVQVLPGEWALAYARARNSEGGDFDRAQRQQQIIFGIRNRVLSQDLLPILVSKAPILYEELSKGVNTNLTLEEGIKLAWLAAQIPEENIKRGVIGPPEYVRFGVSPEGDEVVRPVPAMIRQLRDEVFAASVPVSPAAASAEPKELMQAENARLALLNGASIPGLAARTQEFLNQEGVNVVETSDSPEPSFTTTIIDYTGNPYTLTYLVELMNISENSIRSRFDPSSPVDVALILGSDWANNNPMP